MRIYLLLSLLFLAFPGLDAQEEKKEKTPFDIGFEAQVYPAGFILGTHFEKGITMKDAIHIRFGYNFAYHRDLGVHEDERGGGPGFSLGYRRYFKAPMKGFFLGARNDIWFNTIDWKDNIDMPNELSGTTEITVIQPTAEAGYLFILKNGYWTIAPKIAFGYEINVNQKGADVGEGAILLIGSTFSYRF